MIRSAIYMPRYYAETFYPVPFASMLSITDPGAPPAAFLGRYVALERICFGDYCDPNHEGIPFSIEMAEKIRTFAAQVDALLEGVDFIVHCREGRSRAAAVAKWIEETYAVPILGRPSNVGTDQANTLVLDLLRDA